MKKLVIGFVGENSVPDLMARSIRNIGRLVMLAGCSALSGNSRGAEEMFQYGCNEVDPSRVRLFFPWPKYNQEKKHERNFVEVPHEARLEEVAVNHYERWRIVNTPQGGGITQAIRVARQFGLSGSDADVAKALRETGRELPKGPEYEAPPEVLFEDLGRSGKAIMNRYVALVEQAQWLICYSSLRTPWSGGTSFGKRVAAAMGVPVVDLATGENLGQLLELEERLSKWQRQDLWLEVAWLSRATGDWPKDVFEDRFGSVLNVARESFDRLSSRQRLALREQLPHSLLWEYEGFYLDTPGELLGSGRGVIYPSPALDRSAGNRPRIGEGSITLGVSQDAPPPPSGWQRDPISCRLRAPRPNGNGEDTSDMDEQIRDLRRIVLPWNSGSPVEDLGRHLAALSPGERLLAQELERHPSGLVTTPVAPAAAKDELDYPINRIARDLFGGHLLQIDYEHRVLLLELKELLRKLEFGRECNLEILRSLYRSASGAMGAPLSDASVAALFVEAQLNELRLYRKELPEAEAVREGVEVVDEDLDPEILRFRIQERIGDEDECLVDEVLEEAEAAWETVRTGTEPAERDDWASVFEDLRVERREPPAPASEPVAPCYRLYLNQRDWKKLNQNLWVKAASRNGNGRRTAAAGGPLRWVITPEMRSRAEVVPVSACPPPQVPFTPLPGTERRRMVVGRWGGEERFSTWTCPAAEKLLRAIGRCRTVRDLEKLGGDIKALEAPANVKSTVSRIWIRRMEHFRLRIERATKVSLAPDEAKKIRFAPTPRPLEDELLAGYKRVCKASEKGEPDPKALADFEMLMERYRRKQAALLQGRKDGRARTKATREAMRQQIVRSKLSDSPYGYAMPARKSPGPTKVPAVA